MRMLRLALDDAVGHAPTLAAPERHLHTNVYAQAAPERHLHTKVYAKAAPERHLHTNVHAKVSCRTVETPVDEATLVHRWR
jgi:hypothetical protein